MPNSAALTGTSPFPWRLGPLIGAGAYARVYNGLNLETGERLAVKVYDLSAQDAQLGRRLSDLRQEVGVLRRLAHPHLVRCLGVDHAGGCIRIFLEHASGGSLWQVLREFGAVGEPTAWVYTAQIVSAVAYLHDNGVIHRDVKSSNVLVSDAGVVKVADFGSSVCTGGVEAARKVHGEASSTPAWVAPEVLRCGDLAPAADVWSIGCTVVEMLTAAQPFAHITPLAVGVMKYVSTLAPGDDLAYMPAAQQVRLSGACGRLLDACFQVDPDARATAAELLGMDFLDGRAHGGGDDDDDARTAHGTSSAPPHTADLWWRAAGDAANNASFGSRSEGWWDGMSSTPKAGQSTRRALGYDYDDDVVEDVCVTPRGARVDVLGAQMSPGHHAHPQPLWVCCSPGKYSDADACGLATPQTEIYNLSMCDSPWAWPAHSPAAPAPAALSAFVSPPRTARRPSAPRSALDGDDAAL